MKLFQMAQCPQRFSIADFVEVKVEFLEVRQLLDTVQMSNPRLVAPKAQNPTRVGNGGHAHAPREPVISEDHSNCLTRIKCLLAHALPHLDAAPPSGDNRRADGSSLWPPNAIFASLGPFTTKDSAGMGCAWTKSG